MGEPPRKPCNYCGKPIIWAVSTSSGTAIPLDAAPSVRGNVLLAQTSGGSLLAGVATSAAASGARAQDEPTYLHHAASCPFAAHWNKPQRRTGTARGRGQEQAGSDG